MKDRCPYCNEDADGLTEVPGQDGAPADAIRVSICAYCQEIAMVDGGYLRRPTEAELETMQQDGCWPMLQSLRAFLKVRRAKIK